MELLAPAVLLLLMYVLLIRPQQQRARRQRALLSSLEIGDRITTVGGIHGRIVRLGDDTADVEVADGVVLTFVRGAVHRKVDAAADDLRQAGAGDVPAVDPPAAVED